jgi:hypothetical protein
MSEQKTSIERVSLGLSLHGDLDILVVNEAGQTTNYITVGSVNEQSIDFIINQLQHIKESLADCPVVATHH